MRHASLFSGIGGFDLAAEWMGWENVFQVEIDKFCTKVLEKNFPNVTRYGDIKEFDGTKYRGTVDIISGGFPCQPFSVAGKRKGKQDDRYLWPEMLRVISEVRPAFIVGENVTGIISLALEQVLSSLEAEGYHTETFIIPACAVNTPHRRDRIWIIAYTNYYGLHDPQDGQGNSQGDDDYKARPKTIIKPTGCSYQTASSITNANSEGLPQRQNETGKPGPEVGGYQRQISAIYNGWITEPPICGTDDVIPNRVDRIKSLGNAIVPQVAYEIFKAIETIKKTL